MVVAATLVAVTVSMASQPQPTAVGHPPPPPPGIGGYLWAAPPDARDPTQLGA